MFARPGTTQRFVMNRFKHVSIRCDQLNVCWLPLKPHLTLTVTVKALNPIWIIITHYLQSITPALALGGELVYHCRPGEEGSVMSLVGRYTGESQCPWWGSIDSNWIVGATLEKKLLPLPLSLVLCAFLNHQKNKFQCGFGITIG
ncbi:hypothetical protein XENOCAPTIV_029833 [Xenoophorus captivus]|uniref:Uncharacterized protein n=1 Tax=Xenoophorus captivus TaxID=1517983 RepID=A0ABV0QGF4_9TELE